MDLDGDGIEIAFGTQTFFDVDADGYVEQRSWAVADDGFLVIDLNADGSIGEVNGLIDQAMELAFWLWGEEGVTDMQALAEARDEDGNLIFDSNGNRVLNSDDAYWSSLHIWQDLDQDGVADEGELKTLDEWGITSIGVTYSDGSAFDDTSDDISVFGSTLAGVGDYTMIDEDSNEVTVEGGVGDVALS